MNKLTIIIPTMNRPDFLCRTLAFYTRAQVDYIFLVGDGSAGDMAIKTKHVCRLHNAHYFNLPDISIGETIKALNEKVATAYVLLLADDDLFFPEAIDRIVHVLNHAPDYHSGNGKAAGFELNNHGPHGRIRDMGDYRIAGIEGKTPTIRLQELVREFFPVLFSVYRTEAWRKMWLHTGESYEIGINDEIIPCCLSAILGKTFHIDDLYLMRQFHDRRVLGLAGEDLKKSRDFEPSRQTFIKTLSQYIPQDDAIKLFSRIFMERKPKPVPRRPLKIPGLTQLKIAYLNTKRDVTLPKARQYEPFRMFEELLVG